MPENSDPSLWPFEAFITHEDGQEYCQEARDNGDGTVTVRRFRLPGGFVEENLPKETVQLKERPWDKAKRWLDLFDRIYGPGPPELRHQGNE